MKDCPHPAVKIIHGKLTSPPKPLYKCTTCDRYVSPHKLFRDQNKVLMRVK